MKRHIAENLLAIFLTTANFILGNIEAINKYLTLIIGLVSLIYLSMGVILRYRKIKNKQSS